MSRFLLKSDSYSNICISTEGRTKITKPEVTIQPLCLTNDHPALDTYSKKFQNLCQKVIFSLFL